MSAANLSTAIALALAASACTTTPALDSADPASDPSATLGVDAGATGTGSGSDPGGGGDGGGSDSGGTTVTSGASHYFSHPMFFDRDVSSAPKAATSTATLAALTASGGWGAGRMQIDFAIDVLTADASAPMRSFSPTGDFYSPDCDHVAMPVPTGGNVEDESGYACTGGGDCHLIVYDAASTKLYEMWRADITSTFQGGCLAVWDGQATYGDTLRGDQCTSADAAGFPIAPLLFTADEVAAGHIDHAIRFVLPNNRVKRGFVRPATHATDTTGGTSCGSARTIPWHPCRPRARASSRGRCRSTACITPMAATSRSPRRATVTPRRSGPACSARSTCSSSRSPTSRSSTTARRSGSPIAARASRARG